MFLMYICIWWVNWWSEKI